MDIDAFCARIDLRLTPLKSPAERLAAAVEMLAGAFKVQADEVAVFAHQELLGKEVLRFLWPQHLARSASGYVPLSSDNSLAVRTFLEGKAFINLTFASTPHSSYFEMVPPDRDRKKRPPPIQKIISAPARRPEGFQGVIQLSRKADDPEDARPDFAAGDLEALSRAAAVIARHL